MPIGERSGCSKALWSDIKVNESERKNVFLVPDLLPLPEEFSEQLVSSGGVLIERIISHGHRSPVGFWFDQETDEWVVLLQGDAELSYADGRDVRLVKGDWLLIPAHTRHRVERTSNHPPCIWLAVHVEHKAEQ